MDRFKNIVVGIDISGREHLVGARALSRFSRAALAKAHWIAKRNSAHLHLMTTLDVDAHAEALIQRAEEGGANTVLDQALARLERLARPFREDGLEVSCQVAFGTPGRAIVKDAVENGRDLVVVGTRERGALARSVMGSTALFLVRKAPCAVWIARKGPHEGLENIVAPVDFGTLAPEILKLTHSIALDVGAMVHVLHVIDFGAEALLRASDVPEATIALYRDQRGDEAKRRFDELVRTTLGESRDAVDLHLVTGNAAEEVLRLSDDVAADLVVMGTVVDNAIEGLLLGSTAEKVLPRLDTSLLVLKPEGFRSPLDS